MKQDRSCLSCKHNFPDNVFTCEAYPGGIPLEITAGDVAHFDPLPGDNGIQFEVLETDDTQAEINN